MGSIQIIYKDGQRIIVPDGYSHLFEHINELVMDRDQLITLILSIVILIHQEIKDETPSDPMVMEYAEWIVETFDDPEILDKYCKKIVFR